MEASPHSQQLNTTTRMQDLLSAIIATAKMTGNQQDDSVWL
jgi:hypothetical protein